MISIAELRTLEGSVVAVARGLTAELRSDHGGSAIVFESVTGAIAHVRADGVDGGVSVVELCPVGFDVEQDAFAA